MRQPPRLRLEPHRSQIAAIAVFVTTIATAALASLTLDDAGVCAIVVSLVGATALRTVRRLSRPPLLLHVGVDRSISVTTRDGRTHDGLIHADTSIGPAITTIVWVPDGARWFEPAKTLLVLPDMLPADDFRRLRVYLRHGRSTADRDTSDVAAS